jgi:N6-adenosine-specific RNA methylase IME4
MSADDLKAMTIPAADDCVLFMWAIDPMLPQAFDLIKAWGFQYKTVGFTWAKINVSGKDPIGGGYWTRANPEMCLLATRGQPKRLNADVRQLLMAPRREHSRKPDEIYGRIEALVDGPYLEMFARQTRAGWDAWGNEVGKFDD